MTGDNVNFIDKIDDGSDDEEETIIGESVEITEEEFVTLQEDYSQIRVAKKSHKGIATYAQTGSRGTVRNKTYKQSQFVLRQGAYIRKSTALYLLQESSALSSDRLIRARTDESKSSRINSELTVKSGDLCFFKRVDSDKILAGRVIQFSYLERNKRQREYSGTFVDTSKESYKLIGVFANWFVIMDDTDDPSILAFTPLDDILAFTPLDDILAFTPLDDILAFTPLDDILAFTPLDDILAFTPLDDILAFTPLDDILAFTPLDDILAFTPLDDILAFTPLDDILAFTPLDDILAFTPLDDILAFTPLDDILAFTPLDDILAFTPLDDILAFTTRRHTCIHSTRRHTCIHSTRRHTCIHSTRRHTCIHH